MYYRLKDLRTGDSVLCGARCLDIGHTPSCGLRLDAPCDAEPRILASIIPAASGRSWILTRRDDAADISVDSHPVRIARPLTGGERVSVDSHEYRFSVSSDGDYDPAAGVVYRRRGRRAGLTAAILTIVVAAAFVAAFVFYGTRTPGVRGAALDDYSSSLYRIVTDSVYLLRDSAGTVTVEAAIELDNHASGTAFLTRDSLLVTARHCVEPWIGDEQWDGLPDSPTLSPELALAVQAETANRMAGEEIYRLRTHSVITGAGERYEMYSDDFTIDRSRDQVVCLGTPGRPLYLRSIVPLAHRSDMELGDWARAEMGIGGSFVAATPGELRVFDAAPDREIAVMGYPVNDGKTDTGVTITYGNSQHADFSGPDGRPAGCILMSAPVNAGNSGGPVVGMVDGELRVIGIVSKADSRSTQGAFWAVPATEISSPVAPDGGDTMIFRR